jgi:drug/metabolite transporter (DMT)-like permease
VFAVLSGLFYGLFLLFNNRKIQRTGSSLMRTQYQFVFASMAMLPVVGVTGIDLVLADIPWIVAVGVLHGFLALTLVIAALGHLKTVEYGTISYGEPVTAAILGVVLYDESISSLQIIGCLLVLVAGLVRVLVKADA